MLISIVIPVFNAAPYIERCINSILQQTYKNIELVLIDDCSTDDSYSILKKFKQKDSRVKVYQNKSNNLAGSARNMGVKYVTGDFIWFVDADDWLDNNSIERLLLKLIEHPNIDVLLLGFTEHHSKRNKTQIKKIPMEIIDLEKKLKYFLQLRKGWLSMPFIYVFRKSFLIENDIKFSEGVYFEDILFVAKSIFHARKTQILPQSLYNYDRKISSSITKSISKKKIKDLLKAYDDLYHFMDKKKVLKENQNYLIMRFLAFGLSRCFKMYLLLSKEDQKDDYFAKELILI